MPIRGFAGVGNDDGRTINSINSAQSMEETRFEFR